MSEIITTALFISPQGKVIATHSDYSNSTFGGFSLERAQEIRCQDAMPYKVVREFCSPVIAENISTYTAQKIMGDLISNGFSIHYEKIEIETEKEMIDDIFAWSELSPENKTCGMAEYIHLNSPDHVIISREELEGMRKHGNPLGLSAERDGCYNAMIDELLKR